MAGDSQTSSFSQSVKAKIRETYDYRCVICLSLVQTSQWAHIIDAATAGKQQVQVGNEIVM
jgi:predicted restriction endonuclease